MPDFGIGELFAALGGAELFGGAAAAEGGAALGAEALGGEALAAGTGASALGVGEAAGGMVTGGELFGDLAAEGGATSGFGMGEAPAALPGGATTALPGGSPVAGGATNGLDALAKTAVDTGGQAEAGGQSLFGKLSSGIANDPLKAAGVGLGAGALGFNLWKGSQDSNERKALGTNAAQLGAQGQELMKYFTTGTLPPGLQAQVTKANEAAKARVIQNHAKNGMPTDPSQNSALAQELNSIDQQTLAETAKIGERLLTTGISEVGMADDLYAKLIGLDRQQAQSTGMAIGNFAAALAGRPTQQNQRPGVTING